MTLYEAIQVLRVKLSHVTRDYRPEDEALDVLCKNVRKSIKVDDLANFIRTIDGKNELGAGELAEKICEWLKCQQ